jgi:endoglucanase Acf2
MPSSSLMHKLPRRLATVLATACYLLPAVPAAEPVTRVGAGGYLTAPPPGANLPPRRIYAATNFHKKMPTNDWWSSLAWLPLSERQYPHPLGVQAEAEGLRVFHAGARITANKDGVLGFSSGPGGGDLVIGHSRQPRFDTADVDGFSDWFVTARFQQDHRALRVSYGHGSPFVFARYEGGTPRIGFNELPTIWSGTADDAVLALSVADRHYALFAPTGSTWEGIGTKDLLCRTEKDYFSLALLPDATEATLRLFRHYAHAQVVDTRVSWSYAPERGEVTTSFDVVGEPLEGEERGTLLALYPHQWRRSEQTPLGLGYDSVRGRMKLVAGEGFQTVAKFPGALPCLPNVGGADADRMRAYLADEVELPEPPRKDTYWDGKWLGRTATLVPIAEQYAEGPVGNQKAAVKKAGGGRAAEDKTAKVLLDRARRRLENWFTATNSSGAAKQSGVFYYDDLWGTVIGFPASYGSDNELNDHHFHYGYFIRAAAAVALRDREWAGNQQWGGMVRLLIRDIANADRADAQFPFLRNFDPYAGHSWASGHAKFADGNNNESS